MEKTVKLSDFAKYTSEPYNAEDVKESLAEIKDRASENENFVLSSIRKERDELTNDFDDLLSKRNELNNKRFDLEQQISVMVSRTRATNTHLDVIQTQQPKKETIIENYKKSIELKHTKAHELSQQHITAMKQLSFKFNECPNLYDSEKIKADIDDITDETEKLKKEYTNKKQLLEKLQSQIEAVKINYDLFNLRNALDGLCNVQIMKTYLEQSEKSLDDKLKQFKQD